MSRTVLILLAVIGGLLAGVLLRMLGPAGQAAAVWLQPIGTLWLDALRMTLVPLVFCVMTVGVASLADTAGSGRRIGVAVAVFLILLVAASIAGAAMAEGLLALWPIKPIGGALLAPASAAPATPTLVEQIVGLIPLNPIAAAAETALAPLIVFAAVFGAAAARLPEDARRLLTGVLKASGDAMMIIVEAVLKAAPIGIFVLTLEAAAKAGVSAATGLIQYVLLLSGVAAGGLVCILVVGAFSGVGALRFLRAVLAPLALAASTQSSMACLPPLLKASEELGLPRSMVAAIMPLAVMTFRLGNVFGGVAAGLIGAQLFGIHPGLGQIGLAVGIGVLTNIGVMGLPGQAVLFAAFGPIFSALGTPIEALTLLIAVFTLPDILCTSCSVAGDLMATALIDRLTAGEPEPAG